MENYKEMEREIFVEYAVYILLFLTKRKSE